MMMGQWGIESHVPCLGMFPWLMPVFAVMNMDTTRKGTIDCIRHRQDLTYRPAQTCIQRDRS
jgi:hypothetical protein